MASQTEGYPSHNMSQQGDGQPKCIHEIYTDRIRTVLQNLGGKATIVTLLENLKGDNWVQPSEVFPAIMNGDGITLNFDDATVSLDSFSEIEA